MSMSPHEALEEISAEYFGPRLAESAILIPKDELPPPFDELLVHHDHMTTCLHRYHGQPVALEVLEEQNRGDTYTRKILLTVGETRHVVEAGVLRADLQHIPGEAREEILQHRAPLGDILIRHDVLRRIEPRWFFRFDDSGPLDAAFDRPLDGSLFGRLGIIHCHDQPAIELLEVVAADRARSE